MRILQLATIYLLRPALAIDPKVQQALSEYEDRLAPQDRDAAIAEGKRIAQGWRPS